MGKRMKGVVIVMNMAFQIPGKCIADSSVCLFQKGKIIMGCPGADVVRICSKSSMPLQKKQAEKDKSRSP